MKIRPAPVKTTEHIGAWNIVTASPYSNRDAAECQLRRKADVGDFNAITGRFSPFQTTHIDDLAKRALEGEVQARLNEPTEFS